MRGYLILLVLLGTGCAGGASTDPGSGSPNITVLEANLTAVPANPTSVILSWMNPAGGELESLFLAYSYWNGSATVTVSAFDIASSERLRAAMPVTYPVRDLLAGVHYVFTISGTIRRDGQTYDFSFGSVRASTPREDLSRLSNHAFCVASLAPGFVPAPSNTSVKLSAVRFGDNSSLHLQFNGAVALTAGSLYVMPMRAEAAPDRFAWRFHLHDSFAIPVINVMARGDDLVVVPSVWNSFFVPSSAIVQRAPLLRTTNLRWGTRYVICNRGMITDTAGNTLPNVLGSFTTSPPPSLLVDRPQFNASQLVHPTTVSGLYYNELVRQPEYYNFTTAARALNGTEVRVAVYDEGIWLLNPDVGPGVAFQAVDVAGELLGFTPAFLREVRDQGHTFNTTFNHATWMARFVLDFAPGAALYDFSFTFGTGLSHLSVEAGSALGRYGIMRRPAFTQDSHFHFEEYVQLATALNVSIFSHSAEGGIDDRVVQNLGDQIRQGLVYSKSLGNDRDVPNTIADKNCTDDLTFLPYMTNLSAGRGAFVTLQAAGNNSRPDTIRTHAGDAANYTLTFWETDGSGATSQAAASFAGMMALMFQANEIYDAGFSPRQLVEIMMETANPIPDNRTVFGHGLVNMGRAVKQVQDKIAPTLRLYEDVASSPLFLNHGLALDRTQDACIAQ